MTVMIKTQELSGVCTVVWTQLCSVKEAFRKPAEARSLLPDHRRSPSPRTGCLCPLPIARRDRIASGPPHVTNVVNVIISCSTFIICIYAMHKTALSRDDVLLPHAFERLWAAQNTEGEFQTRIIETVPQDKVVRHLSARGFQVCTS